MARRQEEEIRQLKKAADPLRDQPLEFLERETGFEPATSTLARLHSTTELFPLGKDVFRVERGYFYQKQFGKSRKISGILKTSRPVLPGDNLEEFEKVIKPGPKG